MDKYLYEIEELKKINEKCSNKKKLLMNDPLIIKKKELEQQKGTCEQIINEKESTLKYKKQYVDLCTEQKEVNNELAFIICLCVIYGFGVGMFSTLATLPIGLLFTAVGLVDHYICTKRIKKSIRKLLFCHQETQYRNIDLTKDNADELITKYCITKEEEKDSIIKQIELIDTSTTNITKQIEEINSLMKVNNQRINRLYFEREEALKKLDQMCEFDVQLNKQYVLTKKIDK